MWELILGRFTLEITSADITGFLNKLNHANINLISINYISDLTVSVEISQIYYKKLQTIADKHGAGLKVLWKKGIYWTLLGFLKRPVLVIFAVSLLLLSYFLSNRILFVCVDGNTTISSNLILESAAECGIHFGVSRRQVRSELLKNSLLEKIPQLQWAGVNTQGCTAIISVREKTIAEKEKKGANNVCSIVAARDGIIQNCIVYKGNPLCTVGQAVKAGQTLVSGYIDCGLVIKTTKADAEIRALTFHELTFVSPMPTAKKGEVINSRNEYAILVGKNLIKLTKDSGNLGATCDKIYEENYLHLPGGFILPIAIIKQTSFYYEEITDLTTSVENEHWLNNFAQAYLQRNMIAGEIISAQTELLQAQGLNRLNGKFACIEMIGQTKYEQMTGIGE